MASRNPLNLESLEKKYATEIANIKDKASNSNVTTEAALLEIARDLIRDGLYRGAKRIYHEVLGLAYDSSINNKVRQTQIEIEITKNRLYDNRKSKEERRNKYRNFKNPSLAN